MRPPIKSLTLTGLLWGLFVGFTKALVPAPLSAQVISAPTCSQSDVQAAIQSAQDGDTVMVPAGTCVWSNTVFVGSNDWNGSRNVYLGKAITIQGAGIDQTIILDNVTVNNTSAVLLMVYTAPQGLFRLTGFTLGTAAGNTTVSYGGKIHVTGNSKTFRIDHNKFSFTTNDRAINVTGWLYGVIDHNIFEQSGQSTTIHHPTWGGHSWGDGSWAAPLSLGTEEAVFIEDNIFRRGIIIDGWMGGRHVVRHNTIESTVAGSPVQNHGTESGGRYRGVFSWEVYENTWTTELQPLFHMRGGTGVIFNNRLTGPTWLTQIGNLNNYRNRDAFSPWGVCDGSSPWDLNEATVYLTGAHNGPSVVDGTLSVGGANWEPNQWVGYSLRNITKNWGSTVRDNNANTISIHGSVYGSPRRWDAGDTFEIRRVETCLDQVGRSAGGLISSSYENPLPQGWPNQAAEPAYIWGNTYNGQPRNATSSNGYVIRRGRDYIEDTPRPGYTPFTYPHPLVQMDEPPPNTPPTIIYEPQDQYALVDKSATFSVYVRGSAPLSYQWKKNGVDIPGATAAFYTTPALSLTHSGETYSCVVSNVTSAGAQRVTSRAAKLTVTVAPITPNRDPGSDTPAAGTVSFGQFKNIFNLSRGEVLRISIVATTPASAALLIVNSRGQEIKKITVDIFPSMPAIIWDGTNASGSPVSAGTYSLILKSTDGKLVKKVVVLK